ncbi:ElaB/YqjD/DUF883 family membrane-anchored ribosome-binding protein [Stella humosa]|uniref:ElaB/YqjD/DUF883 family membrane-anchored ribosome-binding protein n=1 Tax=Stella humosa TaxID=94 RepID=A0A3N1KRL2_9PROT|nr:hypothetical protein [Stella humosa]ROP83231.1 ElaB/YqjD/DUF883 family membrane-anchored ribosome-binding protein [Stella humosa]BBK29988.1 hypothetical protein STHU_06220 [Stella humosa]
MASTDREVRKMKSSIQSLQGALATIAGDIEQLGASTGAAGAAGLEQTKAKLDDIRLQIGDLLHDQIERAEEVTDSVKRSVSDNPMTALAAAFAAGVAAAILLRR